MIWKRSISKTTIAEGQIFNVYFPSIWRSEGERVTLVIIWFRKNVPLKRLWLLKKTIVFWPYHTIQCITVGSLLQRTLAKKKKIQKCFVKHGLLVEYFQKECNFSPCRFCSSCTILFSICCEESIRETVNQKLCLFIGLTCRHLETAMKCASKWCSLT